MKFLVIIEKGPNNLSAYLPDLPGCVSTRRDREEVLRNIREAVEGHLEVMREYGDEIPIALSEADEIEVAVGV